jgi:mRNA interferase MazF
MKRPPEPVEPRRGDILWVQCEPSVGAEPRKLRTCVVVSNDIANRYGQTVTVVPTHRYRADRAARVFMVDLRPPRSTLKQPRLANGSMIMTYDRSRVISRAGRLHRDALRALDRALAVHLALSEP